MSIYVPMKAQGHLDWQKIRDALAAFCRSGLAYDRAMALMPASDQNSLAKRMRETTEARNLFDQGVRLPIGQPLDVRKPLGLAARGSILDGDALGAIGEVLDASSRCKDHLEPLTHQAPHLAIYAESLVELPDLAAELQRCFNDRGEVSNAASGELYDLRFKVDSLHTQLKDIVQGLATDEQYSDMLQDDYYTIREDRYVIPIRSGHKNHVDGIVHGWSSSGATVFIEPKSVIDANNRLVYAQAEVDREIKRVLKRLSKQVGQVARELEGALDALCALDFAWSCGQLSAHMNAHCPRISKGGELKLEKARHPLLLLSEDTDVIPNDIALGWERPVLVLTGPNTGGKTVAMKTTGLCTLMALSGLHIPTAPGSVIPWVDAILSDIGDEQSLDKHLSTFSGHIANICNILKRVQTGALVLLDELVVGTDPGQGAALAQAILETFADRGALVVVTTHYENLKVLPYTDARFRNGAMGHDPDTGHPSYILSMDAPGASSALQTAKRLGLDIEIVERAGALAGPQQRALQTVIEDLSRERDTLRRQRIELETELDRQRVARQGYEARDAKLKDRLKRAVDAEESSNLKEAKALRDEIKSLRKTVRRKVKVDSPEWLERTQKKAEAVISEITKKQQTERQDKAGPAPDPLSLTVGKTVWVVSLGKEATVIEPVDAKGRVKVQAGIFAVDVHASDLRSHRHAKAEAKLKTASPKKSPKNAPRKSWDAVSPQIPDNTIDLRGHRVLEALETLEKGLDSLFARGLDSAFIIHGHGTGALKKEVRSWLSRCPYIIDQRPGGRYEGGDGVTAVILK